MHSKTSSWTIFKESCEFFTKHWLVFVGLAVSGALLEFAIRKGMTYSIQLAAPYAHITLTEASAGLVRGVVGDLAFVLVSLYITAYLLAALRAHWISFLEAMRKTLVAVVAGWQVSIFVVLVTIMIHWMRLQFRQIDQEGIVVDTLGSTAIFAFLAVCIALVTFFVNAFGKQVLLDGATGLLPWLRKTFGYFRASWKQIIGISIAALALMLCGIVLPLLLIGGILSKLPWLQDSIMSFVTRKEFLDEIVYGIVGSLGSIIIILSLSKLYLLLRKSD